MERRELTIPDGRVCLSINGAFDLVYNPTDINFVEKLFRVFDELDGKQKTMEAEVKAAEQREIFDISRRADAEMRTMIDGVLGEGACAALWGDINSYAYADGLPLWANLLLAVMDECDAGFVQQQKLMRPRMEKYTAKYRK